MSYQFVSSVLLVLGTGAAFFTPHIAIVSESLPITLVAFVGGILTAVVGLLLKDARRTTAEKMFFFLFVVCEFVTGFSLVGFLGTIFDFWNKEFVLPLFTLPATAAILALIALGSARMGWIALRRS